MRAQLSSLAARDEWLLERIHDPGLGMLIMAREQREVSTVLARTQPELIAEGFEDYLRRGGASDMRVTVLTRDYDGYRVAVDCLADGIAAWLDAQAQGKGKE